MLVHINVNALVATQDLDVKHVNDFLFSVDKKIYAGLLQYLAVRPSATLTLPS